MPFAVAVGIALATITAATPSAGAARRATGTRRLPHHVLPALASATPIPSVAPADESMTLTFVLRRDDQAGFERFLTRLSDPRSPGYRRFLTQAQVADRFGPSQRTYDRLARHLRTHGLVPIERAANRLTLTVRGSRADVERALSVDVVDYRLGDRTFHANDVDPALPRDLAAHVQTVSGLSDLARPRPAIKAAKQSAYSLVCYLVLAPVPAPPGQKVCVAGGVNPLIECLAAAERAAWDDANFDYDFLRYAGLITWEKIVPADQPCPPGTGTQSVTRAPLSRAIPPGARAIDGTNQTIALIQFDTFETSDVADYLALVGLSSIEGTLSQVHVAGGATPGANQAEVLLDVDIAMTVAPGAKVVVYDAPFTGPGTSFQALFNAAIDGGATIISNSWAYCEDQTTLADVQSIDAIFQSAAASGITIFNAAGDAGSTCLDGSPNTVHVPASSPNATAVGGSSVTSGQGYSRFSETWWDGLDDVPPTGQGGFGVSRFFPRPSYQDGATSAPMRSVPDVVANADPARGIVICQASAGGCPTGALYGGTSAAAPLWAAYTALINQALGQNLGFANPRLYPLAGTGAFHDATELGTDFVQVGLGSPNVDRLVVALGQIPVGLPHPETSQISPVLGVQAIGSIDVPIVVPAEGTSKGYVRVTLRDANRHVVSGKTVSLAANPGGTVTITPASGVTNADGQIAFEVTNLAVEDVVFTATDTTDGIELARHATLPFVVPVAASAGIGAFPTTVTADGVATTTITVTLQDALARPTPGKVVTLSQGNGHSIVTAPNPSVTDANGQIQFVATNLVNEVVTYTAVDVTDGDLPIPGSAQVTFNNGTGAACGNDVTAPTAEPGYALAPFANGFVAAPLSFGGVNFSFCSGANGPAFRDGSAFVFSFLNGDVFELPASGGAASSASKLGTVGPTLGWPAIGKDGRLYATRVATTGNFTTGVVVEIDQTNGAVLRTLASNLTCPQGLAVDPLTGDLFVDGQCYGAGSDDPTIHRIRNPADATPTVEVYATLPTTPNGNLAFAPNGSLYVVSGYLNSSATVYRVSGTNGPATPTVTPLAGVTSLYWVNIGEVAADGEARSLITLSSDGHDLRLTDVTANPPVSTPIAHDIGGGLTGPDGCLYSGGGNGTTIFKLTDADGGCHFGATSGNPALALTPATVTPNPPQGTARSFTAAVRGIAAPQGTPVFFQVSGANPRVQMVRTDAAGTAVLTYTAAVAGTDTVVARATIGATVLDSNKARVTWDAGAHVTSLTLNASPRSGTPGAATNVIASLIDTSTAPPSPIAGASVGFMLGTATCSGATNASGVASCPITPAQVGTAPLAASFAGSAGLLPSSDTVGFDVVCPSGLDGVECYLLAYTTTLGAAPSEQVKKPVRKQLLKKAKQLTKLVAKARQPGKKGTKALAKLGKKLGGLAKKLTKLPDKKIDATLRASLLALVGSAQAAVP
jgi:kumamolisin